MIEKICIWLAWHLPKQLVYWCAVRVGANATTGCYGHLMVVDTLYLDVLKRWPGNAEEKLLR